MAWVYLVIAGILEIVWAVGLKQTEGFTKLWPSVITIGSMVISLVLLSISLKTLPISISYAVWVGIGTVGVALIGMFFMGEGATPSRLFFTGLLLAGIIGLKMSSPH